MATFLEDNGYYLTADQKAAYDFIITTSTGNSSFEEILQWIIEHTSVL